MSLDSTELVIEIENSFGLTIPDRDAEGMRTVGDIIRYIYARVGNQPRTSCRTAHMFYRLRRKLVEIASVPRSDIRPKAHWGALIPAWKRRRTWREFRAAGFGLPELRVSRRVFVMSAIFVLVATFGLAWELHSWLGLLLVLPLMLLAWLLTRPLAVHPYPYVTIGASVLYLTSLKGSDRPEQSAFSCCR